jgi:hypothetical protein
MRRRDLIQPIAFLVLATTPLFAQVHGAHAAPDMHHIGSPQFDSLADGGRIVIQADEGDAAAVSSIRRHLAAVTHALTAGDTSLAQHGTVHGLAALTAAGGRIRYLYTDLPRGGELRLVATDDDVVGTIHGFIGCAIRHHDAAAHGAHHSGAHGAHDLATHAAREHDVTTSCGRSVH